MPADFQSNMRRFRNRAWKLFGMLGMVALVLMQNWNTSAQSLPAYDIKPTVTAQMGEVGGKYFVERGRFRVGSQFCSIFHVLSFDLFAMPV